MPKFHVIDGTPKPPELEDGRDKARKRTAKMPRVPDQLRCPRCDGMEVLETKIGMLIKYGRPYGGKKHYICAACHRKGERIVLA